MGCPCLLVHNTACTAADYFSKSTKFDVEEMVVDLFYWFEGSSKRKNTFVDYCTFCDVTYRQVIKHVSTRWLSLATAVDRVLRLYDALRSYFLSEDEAKARFKRLSELFANPITEVYLFFFQSILPVFTDLNLLLQRNDPCIYLVHGQSINLLQKLLGKFVQISVIKAAVHPYLVEYQNRDNQLHDDALFIGFVIRQKLIKLEDISPLQVAKFMLGVQVYYERAVQYIIDNTTQKVKFLEYRIGGG